DRLRPARRPCGAGAGSAAAARHQLRARPDRPRHAGAGRLEGQLLRAHRRPDGPHRGRHSRLGPRVPLGEDPPRRHVALRPARAPLHRRRHRSRRATDLRRRGDPHARLPGPSRGRGSPPGGARRGAGGRGAGPLHARRRPRHGLRRQAGRREAVPQRGARPGSADRHRPVPGGRQRRVARQRQAPGRHDPAGPDRGPCQTPRRRGGPAETARDGRLAHPGRRRLPRGPAADRLRRHQRHAPGHGPRQARRARLARPRALPGRQAQAGGHRPVARRQRRRSHRRGGVLQRCVVGRLRAARPHRHELLRARVQGPRAVAHPADPARPALCQVRPCRQPRHPRGGQGPGPRHARRDRQAADAGRPVPRRDADRRPERPRALRRRCPPLRGRRPLRRGSRGGDPPALPRDGL
ncbi:MAG: hypothetical protein AVDCRST_MAG53-1882, partial [uncultured Solirubrobacteraceae bacterium]